MLTAQHTQLWALSSDSNEYERFRNLLSGRLKNGVTPESINAQTLAMGLSDINFKDCIEVVHDGSDIRKPHSKVLPDLGKVRDLDGDIINGYCTFNSLVISDLDKGIHLLGSTPYSTSDSHYNLIAGAGFNAQEIIFEQIGRCDAALKSRFHNLPVRHILDRGHDDQNTFDYINSLQSYFVIRVKSNRNSDEFYFDADGKKQAIKLTEAALKYTFARPLEKFIWKNKCFQQANIDLTIGSLTIGQNSYNIVKIKVFDRNGKSIFKEPMLLITNELMKDFDDTFAIYQSYLRRSKIETVFKFLKENMGWETFRIHDFLAIQNILSLCFFVAGYFYEHQTQIVNDPQAKIICTLARSKGKITKHFYLKGLEIITHSLLFQQIIKEQNLSQDAVNQLYKRVS